LDLCRLRHLRLHLSDALARFVLHQARQRLPISNAQAVDFIARSGPVPKSGRSTMTSTRALSPRSGVQHTSRRAAVMRANRSASRIKAMSWPHAIASKPPEAPQLSGPKLVKKTLKRITTDASGALRRDDFIFES
jgi:hypothetical protein